MPGIISCQDCGWDGPDAEVEVSEETDHEVWKVFSCPACSYEISRVEKNRLNADRRSRRRV